MAKVIVSLTCMSSRLDCLHLTLETLANQSYTDYEVRVHVSPEPFLLDEGVRYLPERCRSVIERSPVKIKWVLTRNLGPYRKLLPVLADPTVGDALIATADDDTIYPADWLSTLVNHFKQHRCIISYRGHQMRKGPNGFEPYRKWMRGKIDQNPGLFLLPTGKDGVLYHTSFFDQSVLNVHHALRFARTTDDLWFKWNTAANGVPVYIVHTDYSSQTLASTAEEGPSLYSVFNEKGGNDRAIRSLESYLLRTGRSPLATITG